MAPRSTGRAGSSGRGRAGDDCGMAGVGRIVLSADLVQRREHQWCAGEGLASVGRDVAGARGLLHDGCRETGTGGCLRYASCGEISGDQRSLAVSRSGEAWFVRGFRARIAALTRSATRAKVRSAMNGQRTKRSRVPLRAGEIGGEGVVRVAAEDFGEEGGGAFLVAETETGLGFEELGGRELAGWKVVGEEEHRRPRGGEGVASVRIPSRRVEVAAECSAESAFVGASPRQCVASDRASSSAARVAACWASRLMVASPSRSWCP